MASLSGGQSEVVSSRPRQDASLHESRRSQHKIGSKPARWDAGRDATTADGAGDVDVRRTGLRLSGSCNGGIVGSTRVTDCNYLYRVVGWRPKVSVESACRIDFEGGGTGDGR